MNAFVNVMQVGLGDQGRKNNRQMLVSEERMTMQVN